MSFLADYVYEFATVFEAESRMLPWKVIPDIQGILTKKIQHLPSGFQVKGNIAIHKTAVIEEHVIMKGPLIISQNCFIAAHAYLRNGVYLGSGVSLGPGCEIKSSFIFSDSGLAHFNFAGDSIIGSGVNMEAGAVIANHFNERELKEVEVLIKGVRTKTGILKFGAVVGDGSRIGANAVLSPGTLLLPKSIVKRLQLVDNQSG